MRLLSYLSPGFPPSLFIALANAIDAEIEFDQDRSGPAAGADPFESGYDLAWMCSTAFAKLAAAPGRAQPKLVGVGWVPDDPAANGQPVYFSDLVTRPGSGIERFDDLAGRQVACNDRASLSGYYAFRFGCRDRGVDADTFAELVFTGSHNRSLDAVVGGDIDAAAIDSIVRRRAAAVAPRVDALTLIERLGPWPVQPLVAGAGLPDAEVLSVRRRLLAAAQEPELQDELRAASLTGLVEVGADRYESIHRELRRSR